MKMEVEHERQLRLQMCSEVEKLSGLITTLMCKLLHSSNSSSLPAGSAPSPVSSTATASENTPLDALIAELERPTVFRQIKKHGRASLPLSEYLSNSKKKLDVLASKINDPKVKVAEKRRLRAQRSALQARVKARIQQHKQLKRADATNRDI